MIGSMQSGFLFFGAFHVLSTLFLLIGMFFLIFWAIKHLAAHQLYLWGWTLIGTGVILSLLAFLTLSVSGGNMRGDFRFMERHGIGMMDLRDDDKGMTMNDMVNALDGKTGDDFDAAFLKTMIEHHLGAIDMANAALNSAGHDEIKDMANGIITAQQEEIDRMKEWQQSWGFHE